MKSKTICHPSFAFAALALLTAVCVAAPETGAGVSLLDLMNPDDVMLRKPTKKPAAAPVAVPSDQARKAAEEKRRAEEAQKAAEAKAAEEAAARAKAEAKARAEAAAKAKAVAEAEAKAKAETEAKRRAEEARKAAEAKAAEEAAARAKAEAEAKAAAEAAAKAEARSRAEEDARKAAEAKAAEEAAARAKAEAEAKAAAEAAAKAEEKRRAEEEARKAAEAKLPPKLTQPAGPQPDVLKAKKAENAAKQKAKKAPTGRDAVITAERTDYDRKEGVILFDRNVYVDDEQYQLHADRLFLFLDGTNDLKRLVALGNVSITNEEKNAACSRAVYVKKSSKIVMYGEDGAPASLYQGGTKGSTVRGERITFWLNSEQVEIERPVVTVPGGSFRGGDGKDLFKSMKK